MGYIRLIKAEDGYDKEIALWEQIHMIPETIEYWEGESIESIIKNAEDQFGKLDDETKQEITSFLENKLSKYLVDGKINLKPKKEEVNYAKKYGKQICNSIFEDLKKLAKKLYPKANIFYGELDGEWEAKPFGGDKSHYHAVFDFSLPIKYWQEVKNIVDKYRKLYPQVKIQDYIHLEREDDEESEWSIIDIYNK